MYEIGYKLVYLLPDGILCSAFADNYTIYGIETETISREDCGPLCVFNTLETALAHRSYYNKKLLVFKCNYIKSNRTEVYLDRNPEYRLNIEKLPIGTVLSDKVILIEEVIDERL